MGGFELEEKGVGVADASLVGLLPGLGYICAEDEAGGCAAVGETLRGQGVGECAGAAGGSGGNAGSQR